MLKEVYETFSFNILCTTQPKQVPSPDGKGGGQACLIKKSHAQGSMLSSEYEDYGFLRCNTM